MTEFVMSSETRRAKPDGYFHRGVHTPPKISCTSGRGQLTGPVPTVTRWDPAGVGRIHAMAGPVPGQPSRNRAGTGSTMSRSSREPGTAADWFRPVDRVRNPASPGGTWRRPGGDGAAAGRTPGRPGGTWRV